MVLNSQRKAKHAEVSMNRRQAPSQTVLQALSASQHAKSQFQERATHVFEVRELLKEKLVKGSTRAQVSPFQTVLKASSARIVAKFPFQEQAAPVCSSRRLMRNRPLDQVQLPVCLSQLPCMPFTCSPFEQP